MLRNTCTILTLSTLLSLSCSSPSEKPKETKTLRISTAQDFTNLDPRKARTLDTINLMHLLYEGLYKPSSGVSVKEGVAQTVSISEDGTTYQFTLRPCQWSDGKPVTSFDFLESWKTMLDGQFAAPNAYQLFVIKNAKQVYEGSQPISELGIETPDAQTLVVHLEEPIPGFLQMVATPPFFPFPSHINSAQKATQPVGNGRYIVESWRPQCDMTLTKNPHYWAASSSQPNKIVTMILEENTALSMFDKGEIDWIGSPLSALPTDAMSNIKNSRNFRIANCAGTQFMRVNTKKPPLNDIAVRQTLSEAIDRIGLTQHILQGGQKPAFTLLPTMFGSKDDTQTFTHLLKPEELKEKVSKLTLTYAANDRMSKIAQLIHDNWRTKLGIEVVLQPTDSRNLFHRISTGDYDLALGSWYADFIDPSNFLHVFESSTNGTNNTGWENTEYQELLKTARATRNDTERQELYQEANILLAVETPIIPLFYGSFNFMSTDQYSQSTISPLGIISFEE